MIPGFETVRVLGEGRHGRVHLAREEGGLARPVALKVFEVVQDFERELEMLRRVEELRRRDRLTGIVQSLGSGTYEGRGWIALEYLEGGTLADVVVKEGPLEVRRAVRHAREVGAALVALHAAGIFHRDVKPQNILLGSDGHARLGDFGLSRPLDGSLSAAGSPAFAAPEVIAGRVVDGRRADVYSLGATLAFLLTGETILPGQPDVFAFERRRVPRPIQEAILDACAPLEHRTATAEVFLGVLDANNPGDSRAGSTGSDGRGGGSNVQSNSQARPEVPIAAQVSAPVTLKRAIVAFWCGLLVMPVIAATVVLPLAALPITAERAPTVPVVIAGMGLLAAAVLEVLAFVLGVQARARIAASRGALRGGGWALAGIAIAVVNFLPACVVLPAGAIALSRFGAVKAQAEKDLEAARGAQREAATRAVALPNPFLAARKGAWAAFAIRDENPAIPTETRLHALEEWWVSDAGEDSVNVEILRAGRRGDHRMTIERSALISPDRIVADLIGIGPWRADRTSWSSSDVRTEVGEKTRDAKSLNFKIVAGDERATVEVLCCDGAPGLGIAGMSVHFARNHVRVFQLAGYGTKDEKGAITKTWGSTLGELAAELAGELEKSPK